MPEVDVEFDDACLAALDALVARPAPSEPAPPRPAPPAFAAALVVRPPPSAAAPFAPVPRAVAALPANNAPPRTTRAAPLAANAAPPQGKPAVALTAEQQAVERFSPYAPLAVRAGPGAGKTATMVCRVASLVGAGRVPPHSVVVLTYTTAAATEFRTRLKGRLGRAVATVRRVDCLLFLVSKHRLTRVVFLGDHSGHVPLFLLVAVPRPCFCAAAK